MDDFDSMSRFIPPEFLSLQTPQSELHVAARKGNIINVMTLLEGEFDINNQNEDGNTALHVSARNGHSNIVEILLSRGIDMNIKNEGDETALHSASFYSHANVVEILLANGIEIDNDFDKYAPNDGDEDADIIDCRPIIFAEVEQRRHRRKRALFDAFINHHIQYQPYINSIYTQCYPTGNVQVAKPSVGWIAAETIRDKYYFDEVFFYLHMHVANLYTNTRPDTVTTTSLVNSMNYSASNSDKTATFMTILTDRLKMMLKPQYELGIEVDYVQKGNDSNDDASDDDDDDGDGDGDGDGNDNDDEGNDEGNGDEENN